jgi:hypothetical protein
MTFKTFFSIFDNQVFQTIISGLLLFILSQLLLEFILKPRVEMKKLKSLLSEKLLTYLADITNGTLTEIQIKEIKEASSKLLSLAWIVYFRDSKKRQFVDISRNVNGLVSASQSKKYSDLEHSIECLRALKKYKFLKVTFD